MQSRVDPRSIRVNLWKLALAYRALRTSGLDDRRNQGWSDSDIKALDAAIAAYFPDRDPEDIFTALKFAVRARSILDNYHLHLSFMDDIRVLVQKTIDGEAIYTVDFDMPGLPNYYLVVPACAMGAGDFVANLEADLKSLPGNPPIQWREELLPAQPFSRLRHEMYIDRKYVYSGWMLPSDLSDDRIEVARKEEMFLGLAKMLTD